MDLLEREGPLAALVDAHAAAAQGQGSVVTVTGEPGIGKTVLVSRFAEGLDSAGRLLWGGCDDLSIARPLGPLRDLASRASEPFCDAVLSGADPLRIQGLAVQELGLPPHPTVVVLEDVHWADEATIDVITLLSRRIAELPAVLVLTFRSGEIGPAHPLHAALGAIPADASAHVQLQPLSRAAVAMLTGDQSANEVYAATGGNPFYVTELIAALPDELPPSIANAVLGRAARLDDSSRNLVELASLVPSRVPASLLDALLPDWASAAEEPERRQLLTVDASHLQFRHELARNAIRSSMPISRRRRLHRRILDAMLALNPDPVDVVHHAEQVGDFDLVATFALDAARAAMKVGSNREAYAHFRRAADLTGRLPASERAQLFEDYASVAYLVGQVDDALSASNRAIAESHSVRDPLAIGRCMRQLSRFLWYAGDGAAAWREALAAVEVLEPAGPSVELAQAYSGVSQLAMLASRIDETIEWGTRAVELAEQLGHDGIRAHALINIGSIKHLVDPDGSSDLVRAFDIASAAGEDHEAVRAMVNLAFTSAMWVRPGVATEHAERGRRHADDHQVDNLGSYLDAIQAWLHLRAGAWEHAERLARTVRRQGASVSQLLATTVLTELAVRRGDADAEAMLALLVEQAERTGELQRIGPAFELEVEWMVTRGTPIARDRTDCILSIVGPPSEQLGCERARLAAWATVAGTPLPFAGVAPAPHAAMLDGDWKRAAHSFGEVGWRYDRALMLSLLDDADALLEALGIARALDASPLADRAERRLRSLGERVPRRPGTHARSTPAGLTRREVEVVQLLGNGLTNAEIASQLYLSQRTVEHHVSHILTKLDASTRREAAQRAVDLGITS